MNHENELITSFESVQNRKVPHRKTLRREKKKEGKENSPKGEELLQVDLDSSSLHILDYLARDEWIQQKYWARRNDISSDEIPNFPGLNEGILHPWQKIGAAKLLQSCESPLGGMILADATGIGKSLTALVAALEKRKEMLPHCGPVLVVTRPSCAHQWMDEARTHFSREIRPKAMIVTAHDADIDTLLEYDVLICTSSFLKARYLDSIKQEIYLMTVSAFGIQVARKSFPGHKQQHIHMPLHSKMYKDRGRMGTVLIVDEAHDAKNADSLLSNAIRTIRYHYAFLLTATPIYNSWNDLGGIILLLPGSPFSPFDHFRRVFPVPPPAPNEVGRKAREPFSRC
ncbi:hypothetical protein ACHAPA_007371 [Fusarium lateritium]